MKALLAALLLLPVAAADGALAVTTRAAAGDTTNTTTYASTSFTPSANVLLIAAFGADNGSSTTPGLPTCAGGSLTWTQVADFVYLSAGASRSRITIFAANSGGSPGSMTATATYGSALTGCTNSVFEVSGSDVANGVAQCIVQNVATTVNSTGTSLSITLAAAGNANNRSFLYASHLANEAYTIATNWAEIGFGGHTNPVASGDSQWSSAAFRTAVTTSWTTSANFGGIAFEIKAAAAGGATIFRNRTGSRLRVSM